MVSSVSSTNSLFATDSTATAKRHKDIFDALDTDKNGKVDSLELSAAAKATQNNSTDVSALLKQVDTNGDGSIDEAESNAELTKEDQAMQAAGASAGTPPGGAPPAGAPPSGPPPSGGAAPSGSASSTSSTSSSSSSTKVFDKLDTNKDGKVSMEELLAGLQKEDSTSSDTSKLEELFKTIDTNSDGSIDKTESDAFQTKLDEERKSKAQEAATYNALGQAAYDGLGGNVNATA